MTFPDMLWAPIPTMVRWLRSPDVRMVRKLVLGPFVVMALLIYTLVFAALALWALALSLLFIIEVFTPWLT
jgi:hypothetical protein